MDLIKRANNILFAYLCIDNPKPLQKWVLDDKAQNNHTLFVYLFMREKNKQIHEQAMFSAVEHGNFTILKYVKNSCLVNNSLINELIYHAVNAGQLDITKYLIKCGTNINNEDILFCAVRAENLEMVQYLIQQGADIKSKNGHIIFYAAKYSSRKIFRYIHNLLDTPQKK